MDPQVSEIKDKHECSVAGAWLLINLHEEEPTEEELVIPILISLNNIVIDSKRSAHRRP
jgi:hypothetical protein